MIRGISQNPVSIDELAEAYPIQVFPNPATNKVLNITVPDEYGGNDYEVQVYDLMGRLLKRDTPFERQASINVADLNSGVYIVRIKIGQTSYQKMVVVDN